MNKPEGKVIIICGDRGHGKTTTGKGLIKHVSHDALFIHGFRASQYNDIYKKPPMSTKAFTKMMLTLQNAVVVYEEATIYFPHARNEDLIDLLVGSRERNVTIIFMFHSLRSIPRYIWDLKDLLIIHKTQDDAKNIFERFHNKNLLAVWQRVMDNESKYYSEVFSRP